MKKVFFLILTAVLLVASCASQNEQSRIEFSDSQGNVYRSDTASQEIAKQYGLYSAPRIVVVATKSPDSSQFENQISILESMDTESAGILYVVASVHPFEKHGYHTGPGAAKEVLDGKEFKVIGIGPDGKVRWTKKEVVSSDSILDYFP